MLDIKQFSQLKKNAGKSFNDQKAIIKKVMAGKLVKCKVCGDALQLKLPSNVTNIVEENKTAIHHNGISCDKGCTDIALDFVL